MRILIILFVFFGSLPAAFAQARVPDLKISRLAGDFYIFETYSTYQGARISANGMYVVTEKGVVMLDTPWDTTQFKPLLDSIRAKHYKEVIMCIATHFHEDRTGGLQFYKESGIATYTTRKTDSLSQLRNMKRAEFLINADTAFRVGQYSFQTIYPGPGHAPDNIVIWFEKEKILYGGCLIKAAGDETLGNLSDANTERYAASIANVMRKCSKPKYIIPGHGSWRDKRSLVHTYRMAKDIQ